MNIRLLLHTDQTASPLQSSFCLGKKMSVYCGSNMRHARVCGFCCGSAAILNIKTGGT